MDSVELNALTERIITCAIHVHRVLGRGLLESTYKTCLAHELERTGFRVAQQTEIPIRYKCVRVDGNCHVNLLVDDTVIVEPKAVDRVHPTHRAKLGTYLRLSGKPLGLLLNFNELVLENGISCVVNELGGKESR